MDPPLYLSLLTLYNFYVIVIGYLYSPVTGDSAQSQANYDIPAAEKERRQIMKAFYETELKNDNEDSLETSRSFVVDDETESL